MDIKELTTVGKSYQSMETRSICILLVDEDPICHNIVLEMLRHRSYEVLHKGSAVDVLNFIRVMKDRLSVVLTNTNRLGTDGVQIIQHVQKNLNLPVIFMSPDSTRIASAGQECCITAYIVKVSCIDDMHNLWQSALESVKGKNVVTAVQSCAQQALVSQNTIDVSTGTNRSSVSQRTRDNEKCKTSEQKNRSNQNEASRYDSPVREKKLPIGNDGSSVSQPTQDYQKRKRSEWNDENDLTEGSRDDSPVERKRFVWEPQMHRKFLEAIEILGHEKAFPKKIVEVMNVPGLTREKVASHLQKYRMGLKRTQDAVVGSIYGVNVANECRSSYFAPCDTPLSCTSLQGSHFGQQFFWVPSHQGSFGPMSKPALGHSFLSNEASFSTMNRAQLLSVKNEGRTQVPQNNFGDLGILQDRSQTELMQLQQGNIPHVQVNRNFRIYSDRTRNVLLRVEADSSSSMTNLSASSSRKFVGYRLTNNGKSVEFGQQETSCISEIRRETLASAADTSLNDYMPMQPSISTNCNQMQPCFAPHIVVPNENLDQCPPFPPSWNSQQQPSLSLSGPSLEDTYLPASEPAIDEHMAHFITKELNCLPEQSPLPVLHRPANEAPFRCPSTPLSSISQPLYPVTQFGIPDVEHHDPFSSISFPGQDNYLTPLETSGNDSSLHNPLTNSECILRQQPSSPSLPEMLQELEEFLAQEEVDGLQNGTGVAYPMFEWDAEFEDTILNHID